MKLLSLSVVACLALFAIPALSENLGLPLASSAAAGAPALCTRWTDYPGLWCASASTKCVGILIHDFNGSECEGVSIQN